VLLLDSDEHMPVNLGNPNEIKILELAHAIADLAGRPRDAIEYRDLPEDDPKQRRPDITRAQRVLGWKPEIPLTAGLERTLEWARSAARATPSR
jgi:nucleoside-diphosphate-sugar epimerase